MRGPSVVIFGKGFIGSKLYKYLLTQGYRSAIYSRSDVDYTNYQKLYRFLKNSDYDYVVNTSGYTGRPNIDAAEDDKAKCWNLNAVVPAIIARAANNTGSPLFHISSGCIYNGYDMEYTEEDEPNWGVYTAESSFYSKSKHAAELALSQYDAYMFRIRFPFCADDTSRNYLIKLVNYNNLISMSNSLTCVDDLCEFIHKFILQAISRRIEYGPFNVINPKPINAKDIVVMMKECGITNPNHKFIELKDLKTKALRSNCHLSDDKIRSMGLDLPQSSTSLQRCIVKLRAEALSQ